MRLLSHSWASEIKRCFDVKSSWRISVTIRTQRGTAAPTHAGESLLSRLLNGFVLLEPPLQDVLERTFPIDQIRPLKLNLVPDIGFL